MLLYMPKREYVIIWQNMLIVLPCAVQLIKNALSEKAQNTPIIS